MMTPDNSEGRTISADHPLLLYGLTSGAVGGVAEIVWIWSYSAASPVDAAQVARGVTEAVGASQILDTMTVGIFIHMVLAAVLGIAVVASLNALPVKIRSGPVELAVCVLALAMVWAFNFLVLLPAISPAFVTIVPYSVSLFSKILFGLSAFLVFKLMVSNAKP